MPAEDEILFRVKFLLRRCSSELLREGRVRQERKWRGRGGDRGE
jgi:hypothetical protein